MSVGLPESIVRSIDLAVAKHQLPSSFQGIVEKFYWPLAQWLQANIEKQSPQIIGIQGSQGSGKSTCAEFLKLLLEQQFARKVSVVSIDDFYLTRAERSLLAERIHPLLMTRGVPGTHDVSLIKKAFSALRSGDETSVPRFDKATDERMSNSNWQRIGADTDVLIFEGWCVGIPPQAGSELAKSVNALEGDEDADHRWRNYVNQQLAGDYAHIFAQLDSLIALQAPSFGCVFEWRLLQEEKMIERLKKTGEDYSQALNADQIRRFISHYQRLTEHALKVMPRQSDCVLHLSSDHSFRELSFAAPVE